MSEQMLTKTGSGALQGSMPLAFPEIALRLGRYDVSRDQAIALAKLLPPTSFPRVIDICCGVGRLSKELAAVGYDVTGIDLSEDQIMRAQETTRGVKFAVGDMADPPLGPFDVAVNMYSSFGYLATPADDFDCLRKWHSILRPGGRLIMELTDLEHARAVLSRGPDAAGRTTNGVHEQFQLDWETGLLQVDYECDDVSLTVRARLYEKEDLIAMVKAAGFENVEAYGSLNLKPRGSADKLHLIAVKPE